MTDLQHRHFLALAAQQAQISAGEGGVATGAVLVKDGDVVAQSRDRTRQLNDPIAVAEMDCIRQAGRRNDQSELTLYTTGYLDRLGAGTILQFSIGAVVIGQAAKSDDVVTLLTSKNVPLTFIDITDGQPGELS